MNIKMIWGVILVFSYEMANVRFLHVIVVFYNANLILKKIKCLFQRDRKGEIIVKWISRRSNCSMDISSI